MKFKLNNWQIFLVSVVLALIFTFFIAPYYSYIFPYHGGGGFGILSLPKEFTSYPTTFLFLYTFFLSFLYMGFHKIFKPAILAYFLVFPFLIFLASVSILVAGFVILAVGVILGRILKGFINE